MAANPTITQAVEKLGYRVTVGDVATFAGLNVQIAQQGLLALAKDTGGHLQVAESGEIVYLFPKNLQAILRNKFLRLRLQEWWQKVWRVLFYLIRISFGIILLASIALMAATIVIIITATNRDGDHRGDRGGSGGSFMPYFWIGPDWFWVFSPNYETRYYQRRREGSNLNFFEAIFSFLFGEGNPNANLEERRFSIIGTVIRNNGGAVVAEQIAPYIDDVGEGYAKEYEDYMLPVLTRFNGQPVVSPEGQIIYQFPDLQTTAIQKRPQVVPAYLEESPWRFSAANSRQVMLAAGLGVLNLVGALVLGRLLADGTAAAAIGGLVAFVQGIYWFLLGYGTAFLSVPLVRYFWIQWRNNKISDRNSQRQARVNLLTSANTVVQEKIAYARQLAKETVIGKDDLAYTTETDLLDQEANRSAQIDAEWQRRLKRSSGS